MYSLSLWLALGAFGMALGCPWIDFGANLAPCGLPLAPLGVPWGAQGNFIRFVKNWTFNSEQMCLMYRAGAQNLASRNSPPDQADQADPHKGGIWPAARNPSSSGRGLG